MGIESGSRKKQAVHVDRRVPIRTKLNLDKDHAFFYGYRGRDARVRFLSVFEFRRLVTVEMPKVPWTMEAYVESVEKNTNHVELTEEGRRRLEASPGAGNLIAGRDYVINEHPPVGAGWLPFVDVDQTRRWRHSWMMRLRQRPVVPGFGNSPMPRSKASDEEKMPCFLWCTSTRGHSFRKSIVREFHLQDV